MVSIHLQIFIYEFLVLFKTSNTGKRTVGMKCGFSELKNRNSEYKLFLKHLKLRIYRCGYAKCARVWIDANSKLEIHSAILNTNGNK